MRNNLIIFITLLFIGLFPKISSSNPLEDQVITWGDFSNVIRVTSSMTYVYAATTEGIIKYNKIDKKFEDPLTGLIGLRGDEILGIWTDTFDRKLMLKTDAGNFEYDHFFKEWTQVAEFDQFESDVRHIPTPLGMMPPFGFNSLDDGTIIDQHGRNFPINDMIDDGTGTLWIATWGYGLATAEITSKMIELLPYGLIQKQVSTILDEDSLIWLGGPVGFSFRIGLTSFDPEENEFTVLEAGLSNDFPEIDIYCLAGDSMAIYIGGSEGLLVYDRELDQITSRIDERSGLTDRTVCALQVIGDSLFVGTTGGITLIDFAKDSITYVNPSEFLYQTIYDFEHIDNTLWIATDRGAYRLMLDTGELSIFEDPQDILYKRAYALDRYKNFLWLMGEHGLVRLNLNNGETKEYQAGGSRLGNNQYPFPDLAVNGKVAAVSSPGGFILFFEDANKPLYREFSTEDGLPSANVMALKFDGDYLWVGTDRGLSSFWWNNPNRLD